MLTKLVLLVALLGIIVLYYIKKNNIMEKKYVYAWGIIDVLFIILAFFSNIVYSVSEKMGIYFPHTTIVLLVLLLYTIYIFYITIILSKQNKIIVNLTQEISILENKLNKIKENKNG